MIKYLSAILVAILGIITVYKNRGRDKKARSKNIIIKHLTKITYFLIILILITDFYDVYTSGYVERQYWYQGEIQGSELDTPALKIGSAKFILSGELETIFDLVGDPIKVWIYQGKLHLYTIVRDRNGDQMVAVIGNTFVINPNTVSDFNYDEDALEVLDRNGDVILQIQMEKDGVLFCGKFYCKDGSRVAIGNNVIEIRNPGQELTTKFERMFVYPGKNNLGVRK